MMTRIGATIGMYKRQSRLKKGNLHTLCSCTGEIQFHFSRLKNMIHIDLDIKVMFTRS